MAKADCISPFPADLDREAFGHWLSGFTDGEGCFYVGWRQYHDCKVRTPRVMYEIKLRADDAPILELIQSYWGCGYIFSHSAACRPHSKTCHTKSFHIRRISEIVGIVVPHFERFPLRAKKSRDFEVWKQAAHILNEVSKRPLLGRRGRGSGGGTQSKWTPAEYARFFELSEHLRTQRRYVHNPEPPAESITTLPT